MNYGYVDGKIYMHSTSAESHKVDSIRRNEKVSAMGKMMRGLVPAHVGNVMEHCGSVPSDFTMIEITPEHISGKSNLQ